jgi:hypothetical protein
MCLMFEYDALNNTGRWNFTVSQHYIPCVYIATLRAYYFMLLINFRGYGLRNSKRGAFKFHLRVLRPVNGRNYWCWLLGRVRGNFIVMDFALLDHCRSGKRSTLSVRMKAEGKECGDHVVVPQSLNLQLKVCFLHTIIYLLKKKKTWLRSLAYVITTLLLFCLFVCVVFFSSSCHEQPKNNNTHIKIQHLLILLNLEVLPLLHEFLLFEFFFFIAHYSCVSL